MAKSTVIATDIDGKEHELSTAALRWRPSAYGIIIKDDAILLVPAFGGYALPGGGLELGESIEEGLIREVREETGITIANPEIVAVESNFFILPGISLKGNNIQSILLFYRCDFVGGELSDEGFDENEKEFGGFPAWVPLAELPSIKVVNSTDWRKFILK